MKDHFDYIIAGGGAAGLLLTNALLTNQQSDGAILLIDRDTKQTNDRTWCFWHRSPPPLSDIISHCWNSIAIASHHRHLHIPLNPYRYYMIHGIDLYRELLAKFERHPRVTRVIATVEEIIDGERYAEVITDSSHYKGSWVFDSIFNPHEFRHVEDDYHFLLQHFVGWLIEGNGSHFDPDTATMFDFRAPQQPPTSFVYLLPISENRALVEYTIFSPSRLPFELYERVLRNYIEKNIKITEYRIIEKEDGCIPMTDYPFSRHSGNRIMHIGTKGGMVKPSTGFAFARILRDSDAIVSSLNRNGHPFDVPSAPSRYSLYDSMLLNILRDRPEKGKMVLFNLFSRNPIKRIFRFLDEQGAWYENVLLMSTVNWIVFIAAYFRCLRNRRRRNRERVRRPYDT